MTSATRSSAARSPKSRVILIFLFSIVAPHSSPLFGPRLEHLGTIEPCLVSQD